MTRMWREQPALAIALSLVLGATAVADKEMTRSAVKDAYLALKKLIKIRYPKVPIDPLFDQLRLPYRGYRGFSIAFDLDMARSARGVAGLDLEENTWRIERRLIASGAAQDASLLESAQFLFNIIQQRAPGVAYLGDDWLTTRGVVGSEDADAEYVVWYGTNRRPVDLADAGKGYSAERDTSVHHGLCRVFIPKSHKIGSRGSSWWKRLFIGDDRLLLQEVRLLGMKAYWRAIVSHLGTVDRDERYALVFVHGYNFSFEQAAPPLGLYADNGQADGLGRPRHHPAAGSRPLSFLWRNIAVLL